MGVGQLSRSSPAAAGPRPLALEGACWPATHGTPLAAGYAATREQRAEYHRLLDELDRVGRGDVTTAA